MTTTSRLAIARDRSTAPGHNGTSSERKHPRERSWNPATEAIKVEVFGVLAHRDVVLRAVSAACKLVTQDPYGAAWADFQMKVVSAVGEAFNNIVEHGYQSSPGPINLDMAIFAGRIEIELRDWGCGFDPKEVAEPDLSTLPEGGLGLFIIQSFMDLDYRPGNPNILKLSKSLDSPAEEAGIAKTNPSGVEE